jgi:hypothetical protein
MKEASIIEKTHSFIHSSCKFRVHSIAIERER